VLIDKFVDAGCEIVAYDPVAINESKRRIGDKINYATDPYAALLDADCLLIATEWKEFRVPDLAVIKNNLKNPLIFDGRNIYDTKEMKEAGFEYFCIGLPS